MGKRRGTHSEIEFYKGKVKELEKLNKALRRRLRQLEKRSHQYENIPDESEEIIQIIETDMCPNCGKSKLGILDLNIRKFNVCTLCGFRKVIND